MTATRWWVKMYARWIARVQAVQGQLSLFFQAMSGVGIASGALKYLGAPVWAIAIFVVLLMICMVGYIWLFSEGGVFNQKNRDIQDIGSNYAAPTMAMDDTTIGVAVFVALHNRKPTKEERRMIEEGVKEQWDEYRNGLPEEWFDDD